MPVVLETTTNRKLLILLGIFGILLVISFLVGGLVAPSPYNVINVLSTQCLDCNPDKLNELHPEKFFTRDSCHFVDNGKPPSGFESCYNEKHLVFSARFPLPRQGQRLKMSRWFQMISASMMFDVAFVEGNPVAEDAKLLLDIKLGYKSQSEKEWHLLASSNETRDFVCHSSTNGHDDQKSVHYDCELISLFDIGSCFYEEYLVNIRLPMTKGFNERIGKVEDVWVPIFHQNGGFTVVWFVLKTVFFPATLIVLLWFGRRIRGLPRGPSLLEKSLFLLGSVLSLMNLPIDWFSLAIHMPFLLLWADIRQGLFYTGLLLFWVIFLGEHLMDQVNRDRLVAYWKHLSAVLFGCICMFVFEICERGVQLSNPFYSIWVTGTGRKLALAFISLAGAAGVVYLVMLGYMGFKVFRNIRAKKSALPAMPVGRRRYYTGLIYRFYFMLAVTLICAILTVVFYLVGEANERKWKWDLVDNQADLLEMEYNSAFLTGVYTLWNLYVMALLILYAPSFETPGSLEEEVVLQDDTADGEQIEFSALPSEASALAAFAAKASLD